MTDQYLNAGIPTQDDKIVAAQGFATLIGFLISMVTMIVPFAIAGLLILAVLAFLFYGLWAVGCHLFFKARTFATSSSAGGWNAIWLKTLEQRRLRHEQKTAKTLQCPLSYALGAGHLCK